MRYCADAWFILKAFENDPRGIGIIHEARLGKAEIVVPMSTFAESTKKLMQQGVSAEAIELFFQGIESTEDIVLVNLEKNIAQEAAKIALSYNLSMLDAFVAATARIMGCAYVLTKDTDFKLLVKKKYMKIKSW
jgi:predicted nucleic acid-binding protein